MGYTDAFGLMPLREKISSYYKKKHFDDGVPEERIDARRIVVTTGSSGAFLLAFTACFDTGDVVAVASSGYPCYRNILQALGCELANVPINDEFKLTATELRNEIQRRKDSGKSMLKGLILSSPSNPTGAMLSPDELKDLCELCDEEGIRFLSDEIYHGEWQMFTSFSSSLHYFPFLPFHYWAHLNLEHFSIKKESLMESKKPPLFNFPLPLLLSTASPSTIP